MQTAPSTAVPSRFRFTPRLLAQLGLLLLIALYLRTLSFEFVYDDLFIPLSVLNQSWHGVVDAFKNDIFGAVGQASSSYYRPLSGVIGVLIARLTVGTPAWFHLAALLIQAGLYIVCYRFSRLIFEDEWQGALTTLLFILHPTKVETIAWIGSSLCDGQAAIYFFAVLICYFRWWTQRNLAWLLASALFFAAALFTKETMVVLPLLLLVHCLLQSRKAERWRTGAFLIVPYAVSGALYWGVRRSFLKPLVGANNAVRPTFTLVNLWSAPSAFWWYVRRLFNPFHLAILYDFTPVSKPTLTQFFLPLLAILLSAALLFLVWQRTRSWKLIFFAAWFVLTLAPVIALSPSVLVHDRYLQLPAYPLCESIAWALLWLWTNRPSLRWLPAALAALLIIAWSVGTWHESGYWKDNLTLWKRAVEVSPRNVNARVELARLYIAQDPPDLPTALAILDDGLRLLPQSPGLWRARGLYLFNSGSYEKARNALLRSLDASDHYVAEHGTEPIDIRYGRGTADFFIGQIEMQENRLQQADAWMRKALSIQPDNLDYEQGLIANLRKQGRNDEANQHEQIARDLAMRSAMKPAP